MNANITTKKSRRGFSLIELMIVIVIIGALTAIIIPQFDASESEAKDAGCDASNYGTIRQLASYRSINGVYPSRLHTGYETNAAAPEWMGNSTGSDASALAEITGANYDLSTPVGLTAGQATSLIAAGLDRLSYGGFGEGVDFPALDGSVDDSAYVASVTGDWFEEHDTAGAGVAGTEVTINGLPVYAYTAPDPQVDWDHSTGTFNTGVTADGIVIPLFVAPTADWDNAVVDGASTESKIQMAQEGGCPWLEGGADFRYYIAFMKVYDNGDPAKLIGTACPECGSLNP
ncbi:MAG: prepilin-type N-terminal cleavage/methylation domain-containing protein [Verrucomicrobiota bacterium]